MTFLSPGTESLLRRAPLNPAKLSRVRRHQGACVSHYRPMGRLFAAQPFQHLEQATITGLT
jgi:hypothetical protein